MSKFDSASTVKLSRRLPFIVWCFVQLLGLDSEKGRNLELVFSKWVFKSVVDT